VVLRGTDEPLTVPCELDVRDLAVVNLRYGVDVFGVLIRPEFEITSLVSRRVGGVGAGHIDREWSIREARRLDLLASSQVPETHCSV